jgi:radical SAM-linked protein
MRYLAKFEKNGMMIYISHLDTQRLFHRCIKRLKVDLKYSKGYNPHPKLSFAQPLSLGHASAAEYLEFETETSADPPALLRERFNAILPRGVKILKLWVVPAGKSISSQVAAAKYRIEIPFFFSYMEVAMDFFEREVIPFEKLRKKTGEVEIVNIRPMILSLKPLMSNDNIILLTSTLHCGGASNLNPEHMLQCFYRCAAKACDRSTIRIERTALLGWLEESLVPLEYLCGVDSNLLRF